MDKNEQILPSHPWISFTLDLATLDRAVLVALGECASKCEHIAETPLRPGLAKKLHEVYLVKGVQATTAIEGNTLTEEQVRQRLTGEGKLPPSKEYLGQEVDNIIEACNGIMRHIADGTAPAFTSELLEEYNGLVLRNLPLGSGVVPGKLRRIQVGVGLYRGPHSEHVPDLVGRLWTWLNDWHDVEREFEPLVAAVLKAVVAHLYIAWIHPFGDGNGRTARLVELDILLRSGVPSPAVHLLSNHYNATRSEYYRQLEAASINNSPTQFIRYAVIGFRDGLREQLQSITEQVRDVVWRNFVHETFKGSTGEAATRQRHVVLDMSLQPDGLTKDQIATLTPRLRSTYARKTDRTLTRDLAKLLEGGLLVHSEGKYAPNRRLIDAFLPLRQRPQRP